MITPGTGRCFIFSIGLGLLALTAQLRLENPPAAIHKTAANTDLRETTQFRRPLALQLSRNGKALLVANRESGTISLLDAENYKLLGEHKLGTRISDLTIVPKSELFVLTDQESHEIVCFELDQQQPSVPKPLWKATTVSYPTEIRFNGAGDRLAVCGLWSRQVAIYQDTRWDGKPHQSITLKTEFNPGTACWISTIYS